MTSAKQNKHIFVRSLSCLVICACVAFAFIFVDWTIVVDRFAAIGFEPTAEISSLEQELNLTSRARAIFAASRPTINGSDTFNQSCLSTNREISILGCYDGKHIYIYNIDNPDLTGIKQSTLAHELLHAAWDRMSASDQNRLKPELDSIYLANLDELQPRLTLYSSDNFHNELHSIIGTEFAELPLELGKHYAKYFNNQNVVVAFFDNYNDKFRILKAQADVLYEQIESNQEIIDAKSANYDDASHELIAAIADFNRRAESGYFSSTAAFQAERITLVTKQQQLSQLYDEIAALIDTTNKLIGEYNSNVARTQILLDSVNSNASPAPPID